MIKTHSDDPDVAAAAATAAGLVRDALKELPPAATYDYGGHILAIGDYGMCERCVRPIAEAQQAHTALLNRAEALQAEDPTIAEHVQLAAEYFRVEAEAAQIRAELHSGHGSEPVINVVNGFMYDRKIQDDYEHQHGVVRG